MVPALEAACLRHRNFQGAFFDKRLEWYVYEDASMVPYTEAKREDPASLYINILIYPDYVDINFPSEP